MGWYPPRLSSRRRSIASFSESSTSSTRRVPITGPLFTLASRNLGLLRGEDTVPDLPASEREVEGGPLAYTPLRPDRAASGTRRTTCLRTLGRSRPRCPARSRRGRGNLDQDPCRRRTLCAPPF